MGIFLPHYGVVIPSKRGTQLAGWASSSTLVRNLLTGQAFSSSFFQLLASALTVSLSRPPCCFRDGVGDGNRVQSTPSHTLSVRYSTGKMVFLMAARCSRIEVCLLHACLESKTPLAIKNKWDRCTFPSSCGCSRWCLTWFKLSQVRGWRLFVLLVRSDGRLPVRVGDSKYGSHCESRHRKMCRQAYCREP